jgi:integrase
VATHWIGSWEGGRIARLRSGKLRYYLDRTLDGERTIRALDVSDLEGARGELALYNRDPAGYLRGIRQEPDGAVRIDADRIEAFGAHLKAGGRSLRYRQNVHLYLAGWMAALAERDLRRTTLADLHAALDAAKTARKHRVIALKSLAGWLRETGILARADDPTLDLRVPASRPERAVRAKGYGLEHVAAVYSRIAPQDVRDVLRVRCATGCHETELARIIAGQSEIREVGDPCGIAATVRFTHKSGRVHVQSIDAPTLAALRRLIARGLALDNKRQHREIAKACALAGVAMLRPGELRHSFVSWRGVAKLVSPTGGGLALHEVAEAIGHQSARTTQRYYDGLAVPPMVVIPLVLAHVGDP